MSDPVADVARAAAARLAGDRTRSLAEDVEVALLARDAESRRDTYVVDPVSLGSLIVAIAALAWTVRNDLRRHSPAPAPDVIARSVRVRLRIDGAADDPDRDRIVDVVVDEIVRARPPEGE